MTGARVALACLACGVATVACDRADDVRRVERGPAPSFRAPGATVARLADEPRTYEGQSVRVVGSIDTNISPRAFLLRDRGWLWAPKIAVVVPPTVTFDRARPEVGERVRVTGIVHARWTPQLAREIGVPGRELDDRPVIVARVIERTES